MSQFIYCYPRRNLDSPHRWTFARIMTILEYNYILRPNAFSGGLEREVLVTKHNINKQSAQCSI